MTYEMNIGSTDNSRTILKSAVGSGNEDDFLVSLSLGHCLNV